MTIDSDIPKKRRRRNKTGITQAETMFAQCMDNPGKVIVWEKHSQGSAQYLAERVTELGAVSRRIKQGDGWLVQAWVVEPTADEVTSEGYSVPNRPEPSLPRPVEEEAPLSEEEIEARFLAFQAKKNRSARRGR